MLPQAIPTKTSPKTLVVDVRERGLAAELTRLSIPFTTAQLDVGDIMIQDAEGHPLLIAERKSHADFAASNQDGRYREQRARLMAVRGSGVAVLYILEGAWSGNEEKTYGSRTTEGQLRRLTTRLVLRYGMPMIAAASLQDTAIWCRTMLSQLTADATVFQPEGDMATATAAAMTTMTAALTANKKGNRTALSTATAMLGGVPGLGPKRVEALLATKSVAELATMTASEISALSVNGKRMGDALATTIWDALHWKC